MRHSITFFLNSMTDTEYLKMLEIEYSQRYNDPDLFDEINEFEDMEDFE